jgi:hypothetical protein
VEIPDTRYAKTTDGVYLGYQTLGRDPSTSSGQAYWPGNIDFEWDAPTVGPRPAPPSPLARNRLLFGRMPPPPHGDSE